METYRLLVVDDDLAVRTRADGLASASLHVVTAPDLPSALEAISREFFHAAFVDLDLGSGAAHMPEGKILLGELRDRRPACRRFLLTEHVTDLREVVAELLDPRAMMVESVVDKAILEVSVPRVTHALVTAWLSARVVVNPLHDIASLVRTKCQNPERGHDDPQPISDEEVDFVVSSLLGQGGARPASDSQVARVEDDDPDQIASIELEPQTKGRSRSVVCAGRPVSAAGHAGTYCVIKIGSLEDALEERDRYERFMRFGSSSDRRVELLGSAMGDRIGGLCYAFAGRAPGRVTDLESLIDMEETRAFDVLDSMFGGSSGWSENEIPEHGQELGGFFSDAYDLEASRVIRNVVHFADENAHRWGSEHRGGALYFGPNAERILLPSEGDLALAPIRDEYVSAVVHGDLNSANVMVADDGRVMLIDFRHTRRGPRCLDLAALQASIRLSDASGEAGPAELLKAHRLEGRLLADMARGKQKVAMSGARDPYWVQLAWDLMKIPCQTRPDITVEEYAATCFLYALRVLRVTQLSEARRLRLLVWVSALITVLRRPSGASRAPATG